MSILGPRVHPKITKKEDVEKIIKNQSLLTEEERELIEKIKKDISGIQDKAKKELGNLSRSDEIIKRLRDVEQLTMRTNDNIEFLEDLISDLKNNKISIDDTLLTLIPRIQAGRIEIQGIPKSIKDDEIEILKKEFRLDEPGEMPDKLISILESIKPQKAEIAKFEEEAQALRAELSAFEEKKEVFLNEIEAYKMKHSFVLDVDKEFNLTKISRKSKEGPQFSVIFSKREGEDFPFILYHGKSHVLGEGGFGKVKLAQSYHKNELGQYELVAVKIVKYPGSSLDSERARLGNQLKGTALRKEASDVIFKDYTFMTLYYGEDGATLLESGQLKETEALRFLLGAAQQVKYMHDQNKIHRDIKPENFIFDKDFSETFIIDFGSVEDFQGKEPKEMSFAGTPGYIAPEAQKERIYSKGSDIYSFGKMVEVVLSNYPNLSKEFYQDIQQMTADEWSARPNDLKDIIEKISQSVKKLEHEKMAKKVPSSPLIASYSRSLSADDRSSSPDQPPSPDFPSDSESESPKSRKESTPKK